MGSRTRVRNPRPGTITRREVYRRRKLALIDFLGGRCELCGESRTWLLTFDHRSGHRDWEPREVHSTKRLRIYTEEALNDQIQLLCSRCNAAKGNSPEDDESF